MSEGFFQHTFSEGLFQQKRSTAIAIGSVAHPLAVKGRIWKPFVSYEAFYDQGSGWTKNRVWTGVTVPLEKHVSFQPSYMWEGTQGIKDLNYLMFGLIFNVKPK
jgi:hypothetical protein